MKKVGHAWRSGENALATLFERQHGASALQKRQCHCGKTGIFVAGKEAFCYAHKSEAYAAMRSRSSLSMVKSIREMEKEL
jgi:hypothetical protein